MPDGILIRKNKSQLMNQTLEKILGGPGVNFKLVEVQQVNGNDANHPPEESQEEFRSSQTLDDLPKS
jgi:hypothetical protein